MQGSLLVQLRPSGTTPVAALTPTIRTEISRIIICNTTGSAATFSLYHDDDGTSYDQSTALYYGKSVAANDSIVLTADTPGLGMSIKLGGNFAVQTGTASALTFSIYGSTLNVAPNQSRV